MTEPLDMLEQAVLAMSRMPLEEADRLRALLAGHRWIFAKTMPQNPHWYTLRREWESDEDFSWAVSAIRQYGVVEKYRGSRYRVLIMDGYKYWTMGWPVPATILINRKPVDERGRETGARPSPEDLAPSQPR